MIKKLRYIVCTICCLFILEQNMAQNMLTETEAIATALQNNYNIALIKQDSSEYALNSKYQKTAYLPSFNANTGLLLNNNNQFQIFTDGTSRKRNNILSDNIFGNLQMTWTIFNGYKISLGTQKWREYVQLGNLGIRQQTQNTIYEILKAYYTTVYRKQIVLSIEEQMTLNEERIKLANQKLKAGLGSKPELLQAKVDWNAQKTTRLAQIALYEKSKQQLNQIQNITTTTNYTVSDSIPINMSIILNDITETFEQNNPDLLLLKKNASIAAITLKENKAEKYPLINFNGIYNYSRTDNRAVVNNFSPLFNRNNGMQFGIGIAIPIFNNNAVNQQVKLTEINIAKIDLRYKNEKAKLELAIHQAFQDYQSQKQILELELENIVLAKENVQIAFERFKAGITGFIELKIAQTSLEAAYSRLLTARYQTKLAEIELLKLKGY